MRFGDMPSMLDWTGIILPAAQPVYGTVTTAGFTLPVATINVSDTTDFPASGRIYVGPDGSAVDYTGKTGTSFTGCTGGSGIIANGALVTNIDGRGQLLPSVGLDVLASEYPGLDTKIGSAAPAAPHGRYAYSAGSSPGAGKFRLPEGDGRLLVSRGRHTDLVIGTSDNVAKALRKLKHKHGRGTLGIANESAHGHTTGQGAYPNFMVASSSISISAARTDNANAAGFVVSNGAALVNQVGGTGTGSPHSHGTSGEIGDTNGQLDAPAHQVIGGYVVIA